MKLQATSQERYQSVAAVTTESSVFWNVIPQRLFEIHRRFGESCCIHQQARLSTDVSAYTAVVIITLELEAAGRSLDKSHCYQNTRRQIPEDGYFWDSKTSYNSGGGGGNTVPALAKAGPDSDCVGPLKVVLSCSIFSFVLSL